MEKHPSVFTIAAFDFIERPEATRSIQRGEALHKSVRALSQFCKKGVRETEMKPIVACRQPRKSSNLSSRKSSLQSLSLNSARSTTSAEVSSL